MTAGLGPCPSVIGIGAPGVWLWFKPQLRPCALGDCFCPPSTDSGCVARSGDHLALQLLFCGAWCYVDNPGDAASNYGSGQWARLTNRVEFVAR
jgi:hypothetical protein